MTQVHARIFWAIAHNSPMDGDLVDLDDSKVEEFIIAYRHAKRLSNRKLGLRVEFDDTVWYGDRQIHVQPKPTNILKSILAGQASSRALKDAANSSRVDNLVGSLNRSFETDHVPHLVEYDRKEKIYKIL